MYWLYLWAAVSYASCAIITVLDQFRQVEPPAALQRRLLVGSTRHPTRYNGLDMKPVQLFPHLPLSLRAELAVEPPEWKEVPAIHCKLLNFQEAAPAWKKTKKRMNGHSNSWWFHFTGGQLLINIHSVCSVQVLDIWWYCGVPIWPEASWVLHFCSSHLHFLSLLDARDFQLSVFVVVKQFVK